MDETAGNPIPYDLRVAAALWYRGGYTQKHRQGYIMEYCPYHPYASRRGLVMQHRLVMERHLGRLLTPMEVVHHVNENTMDNAFDNLELHANQSEHAKAHQRTSKRRQLHIIAQVRIGAANPRLSLNALARRIGVSHQTIWAICREQGIVWTTAGECHVTEAMAATALQGHSPLEAATLLGISVGTIYRSFGHLFPKRRPPQFLDAHKEQVCRLVLDGGVKTAADAFATSRNTIWDTLRRWSASGDLPNAVVDKVNGHRGRIYPFPHRDESAAD